SARPLAANPWQLAPGMSHIMDNPWHHWHDPAPSLPTLYCAIHIQDTPMSSLPPCPLCASTFTYQDGAMLMCPECAHEWSPGAAAESGDADKVFKDANGNVLQDGDTVTVIKDLKVKGSSLVVKVGTKVKNIRL